jgi:hypothetical protein
MSTTPHKMDNPEAFRTMPAGDCGFIEASLTAKGV